MGNLHCEYLPLDSLKPYAKNARTHSRKQLKQIADSIRSFGFTNPILIDNANTILAGHGRVWSICKDSLRLARISPCRGR